MTYKILYFEEVRQDVKDAKQWYRNQSKGLEKRFAEDIKISISRLKSRPAVHAIRYKNIRVTHPDVFPYSIHFYIDEKLNAVVITAIVHNSRDPMFSKQRK